MDNIYFYCSVVGGFILVVQTLLLLVGGDSDVEAEIGDVADGADAFLAVLSFKTIVAFLTFFGLTGMACLQGGFSGYITAIFAFLAGSTALYLVAWMMRTLSRLQSRGNLDLQNAIGQQGKVYLRVPPKQSGTGRVILNVQGRRVECQAVTTGPELITGTQVIVLAVPSLSTLEVEAITS